MEALGLGVNSIWGLSPAIDLYQEYLSSTKGELDGERKSLKFLLVDPGDIRHILKTISNHSINGEEGKRPHFEFYIWGDQAPNYCRILLQLYLCLSPLLQTEGVEGDLTLQERAELFLELYGNSMLRASTHKVLDRLIPKLIGMVRNDSKESPIGSPVLNLERLRYRDRDDMEFTLQFWRPESKGRFDLPLLWDYRLRRFHGIRYEALDAVADWDYHMKLEKMAPVIRKSDFTEWRRTGVAFRVRDSDYDIVNRTFATTSLIDNCNKWGYFSDITQSPYIPFGVADVSVTGCGADLFKTGNGIQLYSASEVAEHNLKCLLYQLETGLTYNNANSIISQELDGKERTIESLNFSIHFLDVTELTCTTATFKKRTAALLEQVDLIWVSLGMAQLYETLANHMKPATTSLQEDPKWLINLKDEQKDAFRTKVTEYFCNGNNIVHFVN